MSMTAEERAGWLMHLYIKPEKVVPATDHMIEWQIAYALRAHANAALEEAAAEADGRTLSSEACRTDGRCSHVQCLIAREIAAAIRALHEEPVPPRRSE